MAEKQQGFKLPEIKIKYKFYEVIAPIPNVQLKMHALSNSDLVVLSSSSALDSTTKMTLLANALYNACLNNKEVFNDFEFFARHMDFDNDLAAMLIGTLVETYGEKELLKFQYPCEQCGTELKFSIPYSRLVSDIKVNPKERDFSIYEKDVEVIDEEVGIKFKGVWPSIQRHIGLNSLIEQITKNPKVFDVLEIPELKRDSILIHLGYLKYIKSIISLENGATLDVDFETNKVDEEFLIKATYAAKILGDLPTEVLGKLPEKIFPEQYGLKCEHKKKCHECGHNNKVDAKPLLPQLLFP